MMSRQKENLDEYDPIRNGYYGKVPGRILLAKYIRIALMGKGKTKREVGTMFHIHTDTVRRARLLWKANPRVLNAVRKEEITLTHGLEIAAFPLEEQPEQLKLALTKNKVSPNASKISANYGAEVRVNQEQVLVELKEHRFPPPIHIGLMNIGKADDVQIEWSPIRKGWVVSRVRIVKDKVVLTEEAFLPAHKETP